MRLAIIQNLYKNYIDNFEIEYASQLNNYKSSLASLRYDSFSWSGCWGEHLSEHGIEVVELYVNFDVLNAQWCQENDFIKNMTPLDVLIQQLKRLKIDVVLNADVDILRSPFIRQIKAETNVKYIYAHVCSNYYSYSDVSEYDGIFTCMHWLSEVFKGYGKPAVYLPHCFNSKVLERIEPNNGHQKINKVFFAGGVIKGGQWHDDREKLLLDFISNGVPMSFFSEIANFNYSKGYAISIGKINLFYLIKTLRAVGVGDLLLSKIPLIRKGLTWEIIPDNLVNRTLFNFANKPIYGLDFFSKINNYSVSLNNHGGVTKDEAANMRLFEATGVGAALLTDHKSNLSDFFDIDKEVVTYKTKEEAREKATYLLNNPTVSDEIGKAGQKRVLKDHTFKNRAPILASSILNNFV